VIEEPGGGTRPDLPVVLAGHVSSGTSDRVVSLRSILGANAGAIGAPRRAARWGSFIAWCGAVLVCAGSAFAIRDTMFPALGRTEAPSAWEAPTRPIVTIPYLDREGRVPVNTAVEALSPVPAAGGTPLGDPAGATSSVAGTVPNDDHLLTPAPPTGSQPVTTTGTSPNQSSSPVTVTSAPSATTDDSAPSASDPVTTDTTVDSTVTTTVTSNTDPTATTLVDDGTGNRRGRGTGGSTGGSTP
jgi:hypothetical protein